MLAACPRVYLFPLLFFQAGHHLQADHYSLGTLVRTWGFSIQRFTCWSKMAMAWSLNPFLIRTLCDQAWLRSAVQLNRTLRVSVSRGRTASSKHCVSPKDHAGSVTDCTHPIHQFSVKWINSYTAELLLACVAVTAQFLPVLVELFAWLLLVCRDICQINHFCRAEIDKCFHFLPSLSLG